VSRVVGTSFMSFALHPPLLEVYPLYFIFILLAVIDRRNEENIVKSRQRGICAEQEGD
jgi:hypothetical protein